MLNLVTRGKAKVGSLYAKTLISLNGVALSTTFTILNFIAAAFGTVSFDRAVKIAKVPLVGVVATTGGAVGVWQNPEAVSVMIDGLLINTTVKSTGAANLNAGSTPTSAATSSANLIDTLDVGTATVTADNFTDKGTNGKSRQLVAAGKWVTFTGSADTTGLLGAAYISYVIV